MQKFIVIITKENLNLLENPKLECFILSENLSSHFKNTFASKAKNLGKLVLGLSTSDCLAYHLDGIIIDLSHSEHIAADYKAATKDIKGKFIGAITRNRRHESMLVSECEPDFIIFKAWQDGVNKTKELTDWYDEMFLIQSALLLMEDIDFRNFKTDFVILEDVHLKAA